MKRMLWVVRCHDMSREWGNDIFSDTLIHNNIIFNVRRRGAIMKFELSCFIIIIFCWAFLYASFDFMIDSVILLKYYFTIHTVWFLDLIQVLEGRSELETRIEAVCACGRNEGVNVCHELFYGYCNKLNNNNNYFESYFYFINFAMTFC